MIEVGFDIGGTFTDFVLRDTQSGRALFLKTPTTPADLSNGVALGLETILSRAGVDLSKVASLLHATTVGANAIIERKGSRTALITTKGFRDVLFIGRSRRPDTFNLDIDRPSPFLQRRDVFEVSERIDASGKVVTPLVAEEVERIVDELKLKGYESVAISFLHSYLNNNHELLARRIVESKLDVEVSLSSEVSPRWREYERTLTTVANAYIKPVVSRYISKLKDKLSSTATDMQVMQSNGGLLSTELSKKYPIRIVESGPAAGVLMAAKVGMQEECKNVLTFDMGGTTAKLGASDNGKPAIVPTFEIDTVSYRKGSGLPLNISAVELIEIGAGGGSIAVVQHGIVKVGPKSAGADPGPICYGRGGEHPTVTDANVVLGYINPRGFNAGTMDLSADAARAGIEKHIAAPLKIPVIEAAWGIHALANHSMARAMRVISEEHGRDPRKYALVAFGGAGPIHGSRLAATLGIPKLIVPVGAGVGSALGLLGADLQIDVSVTRPLQLLPEKRKTIAEIYSVLQKRASTQLSQLHTPGAVVWARYAYMRYVGQGFELRVDLPGNAIDDRFVEKARSAFNEIYLRNYGFIDGDAPVEVIDWYLVASVPRRSMSSANRVRRDSEGREEKVSHRPTYMPEAGGMVDCRVVNRYEMKVGQEVPGPAIIEENESSTLILPKTVAQITPQGHLVVDMRAER